MGLHAGAAAQEPARRRGEPLLRRVAVRLKLARQGIGRSRLVRGDHGSEGTLQRALRRFGSVRVRATVVAVIVVASALAIGGFGLVRLLNSSLEESVERAAHIQAENLAALARSGQLPRPLPEPRDAGFATVVDSTGRVVAESEHARDYPRVTPTPAASDSYTVRTIGSNDESAVLVVSRTVTPGPEAGVLSTGGPLTVNVGASLTTVDHVTETTTVALAAGLPVLVAIVGLMVWFLTGRALQPVEAIRSEVSDVSGRDLHRRVPVPAADDEIRRLAKTMNEMLDRLEASALQQRRFISDASHELRSPVASIEAQLEVAMAHPEAADWQEVAPDVLEEGRRLHRLIDDLIVLARAGERTLPRRNVPVDLDELVLAEARRVRAQGRVQVDAARVSGGRVSGHEDEIASVVRNLVDNAERHASSTVRLELRTVGSVVELVVADNGEGVAEEDRERVFDRFARLDSSRERDRGGSGLGLAIAKELVTAHGGTVELADPGPGGGARFVVHLPALDSLEDAGP